MTDCNTDTKKKLLYVITKSNLGEKENYFSFSPVLSYAQEQPLPNNVWQAVGGPTKLHFT